MIIEYCTLYQEEAGVISENKIWILTESCYMYEDEDLGKLLKFANRYWHDDRNLVG